MQFIFCPHPRNRQRPFLLPELAFHSCRNSPGDVLIIYDPLFSIAIRGFENAVHYGELLLRPARLRHNRLRALKPATH